MFAFLWGALVAVVGAFFLNTFGLKLLVEARWTDPLETGAVYLAPFTEETLKGLGILLIYLLRRREFDGIIDGIVYAGLIGAGFAFSENILYLGQAYNEYGGEGLTSTFVVRGLMGPFGHPLFTSLTGIGIGIAVDRATTRGARRRRSSAGWVCAMLLPRPLEPLGARRHGRLLRGVRDLPGAALPRLHRLPRLAPTPRGPPHRAVPVALRGRRLAHARRGHDALAAAAAPGGAGPGPGRTAAAPAKRSMHAFQDSASELALLRSRLVHGTAEEERVRARDGAARGDHGAPA